MFVVQKEKNKKLCKTKKNDFFFLFISLFVERRHKSFFFEKNSDVDRNAAIVTLAFGSFARALCSQARTCPSNTTARRGLEEKCARRRERRKVNQLEIRHAVVFFFFFRSTSSSSSEKEKNLAKKKRISHLSRSLSSRNFNKQKTAPMPPKQLPQANPPNNPNSRRTDSSSASARRSRRACARSPCRTSTRTRGRCSPS